MSHVFRAPPFLDSEVVGGSTSELGADFLVSEATEDIRRKGKRRGAKNL